jgi:hypothetical protein
MGYRRAVGLASALAVLGSLVAVAGSAVVRAGPPTPTIVQPPAPPTQLHVDVNSDPFLLVWNDNSDNEDGFRIRKHVGPNGSPQDLGTLPANTTTTELPQAPDDFSHEEACRGVQFSVVAFNAAGDSPPSNLFGPFPLVDCAPPPETAIAPTATVAATVTGPGTGTGGDPGGNGTPTGVLALAAAVAAVIVGGAAVTGFRRRAGGR